MASNQAFPIETRLFINNQVWCIFRVLLNAGHHMADVVQFVEAKSGKTLSVYNPFDESVVTANIHVAGKGDIDDAVSAAESALKGPWGNFSGVQRAACLNKFADLLEKNAEKLAYLDAICMGMPVAVNAGFIVPASASVFRC